MSAIFGAVNFSNNKIDLSLADSLHEGYKDCKIDRFSLQTRDEAFMGAELQYFTKEAKDEVLPIVDEVNKIMFTADCYLDYRKELIEELSHALSGKMSEKIEHQKVETRNPDAETRYHDKDDNSLAGNAGIDKDDNSLAGNAGIDKDDNSLAGNAGIDKCALFTLLNIDSLETAPDGSLMYLAYLLWPDNYMDHLRGTFSFVAYHYEKGYVRLQTDHFSSRSIYYQISEGTLYFSTLFFPLIHGTKLKYEENERWLLDTLTLRSPMIITEPEETAVCGVKKIVAGQYVNVSKEKVEKVTYYDPVKTIRTNKRMTDKECEEKVRALMKKSVGEMLRTDGEVAVLLSAGLDSSMVACIASPLLEAEGKRLYSYTSVPLKEANLKNGGYRVFDETEGVMKIVKAYPNIEPAFVDCPDKSILSEMEAIIKEWELPCKSEQNAVWLREIKKMASDSGCKVLLSGATGNCTISAGNLGNYLRYEFTHFHPVKAYKGFNTYMEKYHGIKRSFAKNFIKAHLAYYTWYFNKDAKDVYANGVTRKDIGDKYNVEKRFNKELLHYKPTANLKRMRKEIYLINAYAQMGPIETASSLYRGMLERDPMRNVDFINFCMSLPMRCFNNGEYDRRLVREFMHGIVPDEIRLDVQHRGQQSADNEYRIDMHWAKYKDAVLNAINAKSLDKYVDTSKKNVLLDRVSESPKNADFMETRMIADLYSFGIFVTNL